ncbi:alpha-amylase [Haliovirga abyssi]|uniref:Alpha-amylase n=1 Tax=Haliovirga abyssi TaxID=2996794 RepID=A0AAU9E073_9FUSO|nr:alpha-amylase [Haliovirga abyssi]BDU51275.1 alpha-amylase [Haliovirga abyssi]
MRKIYVGILLVLMTFIASGSEWTQAYFRGTANGWGTTAMSKISTNTWQTEVTFNGESSPARFKIDHYGDWSENYPAQDYQVTDYKTYKITFYDDTHNISVTEVTEPAPAPTPTAINGTMMQYFHWYYPADGSLWNKVSTEASNLSKMGITALWLPPAYKGAGGASDVGYGVYDMYDLGEFNQKGTIRTKYGTKDQYINAISNAHSAGLQVYGDIVFNHRGGADATETVEATKVDWNNRNLELGTRMISAWTKFDFPGRNNKYSSFKWRWYHFDGVDWDDSAKEKAIFRFDGTGKGWDWEVDGENGNYDYLMYADLDMDHPEVVQELKNWGKWYVDTTGVDGFRLDAVKHIKFSFFKDWVNYERSATGKELFTVGEYWNYDVGKLENYITKTSGVISLFDAPLHMNFYSASKSNGNYDMRNILNGTLMKDNPSKAVTIVDNHDTQPLQALESPVEWWFKPLAYSIILLRQEGYPCVFYPDVYGASYTDKGHNINMAPVSNLSKIIKARKLYAYGVQKDYLDNWDVIGWTRLGDATHSKAMAVILTDGGSGSKWMDVGRPNAVFYDYLGNRTDKVYTNSDGWGEFKVNGGSASVWVQE